MKGKGQICITRPMYGDGRKRISIRCRDELSCLEFLEIEIPYDQFAMALTSTDGEMEFDLRGADLVGKKREHKKERVWMPDVGFSREARERAAKVAIAAVERDGWKGRVDSALNPHNRIESEDGGDWYNVSFHRYVDVPAEES